MWVAIFAALPSRVVAPSNQQPTIEDMHIRTAFLTGFLVAIGLAPAASAQAHPDSLLAWAARLESGTLEQRAAAAGRLHAASASALPAEAQEAVIAELNRINDLLVSQAVVPGALELGYEGLGEYYLNLTLTVTSFDTPAATCALVRSVGVGGGIQRRVARQGDPVVGDLAELIGSEHQPAAALETLALAWFWADSTGAPLSPGSRGVIAREIVAATSSSSYKLVRASATAMEFLADPAFLPLAQSFNQRAMAANHLLVSSALERKTIPRLSAAAQELPVAELSSRVQRAAAAVCAHTSNGPKRGVCRSTLQELEAARVHLEAGRLAPARSTLQAIARRVEQAAEAGALQPGEADVLAGGARMLLERM